MHPCHCIDCVAGKALMPCNLMSSGSGCLMCQPQNAECNSHCIICFRQHCLTVFLWIWSGANYTIWWAFLYQCNVLQVITYLSASSISYCSFPPKVFLFLNWYSCMLLIFNQQLIYKVIFFFLPPLSLQDKKAIKLGPEDSLYIEGFALNVFGKADKQDHAGRADLYGYHLFFLKCTYITVILVGMKQHGLVLSAATVQLASMPSSSILCWGLGAITILDWMLFFMFVIYMYVNIYMLRGATYDVCI